jgi:hypothetical protein
MTETYVVPWDEDGEWCEDEWEPIEDEIMNYDNMTRSEAQALYTNYTLAVQTYLRAIAKEHNV